MTRIEKALADDAKMRRAIEETHNLDAMRSVLDDVLAEYARHRAEMGGEFLRLREALVGVLAEDDIGSAHAVARRALRSQR